MTEKTKIAYAEPQDYFSEETRRKFKLGEFAESEEIKQIKAVMLGHAVGDALGVPVEFCSREELDENPVTTMMGWGSYPVPEGCWSDDTSMALATLDSLKNGRIDYDEIMKNFVAWCTENKYTPTGEMFDIGRTCMGAIRNYLVADGKTALECGLSDEHSNGNGSLMRIHPMAMYLYYKGIPREEAIEIIHNTSAITHAHPRSKLGCEIYARVLWAILDDSTKWSCAKALEEIQQEKGNCDSDEFYLYYRMLVKRIAMSYLHRENPDKYKHIEREEISSTGYVVDTLEAAIWCILTTKDYKECVLKAVNLGGDTDTIAAIAGGLAGAMYGLDAIPQEWLDVLKKRKYIEEMCESACLTWI